MRSTPQRHGRRQAQLAKRPEVKKQLLKIADSVERGFIGQVERADDTLDYWDIYNCKTNSHQFYSGNSKLFVPLVHNAVEARKTRNLNQIFPLSGRYIEVTTEDGEIPHASMALHEYYVERAELRTKVIPALLAAGDVEGQYTVQVTWGRRKRVVVSREIQPLKFGGVEMEGLGEEEVFEIEEIEDAGPEVDIVPDADLLVLPATSDTIEDALDAGGCVATICRWSQAKIEDLIDKGEIDGDLTEPLTAEMIVEQRAGEEGFSRNVPKKLADEAGIKSAGKFALIYRIWAKVKIKDERRLVLFYYGGEGKILGCRLCPYWCDKPDIISMPVKKMPGVFKGLSLVKPCADMQYAANDAINEGMDSATYSMLPVIMTDPEKNPRVGSMVMDLMAIWEVSPQSTQAVQFPQLYQHAFNIVQAAERYINQTLGTGASMIPQSTGVPGRKRNQAEIALEQQVDLLSTSVEVTGLETGVLTPMIQRFAEYDAQFRDEETTVRTFGQLGVKAEMQTVPPYQAGKRWRYRWFGVEAARTAQQIQQQIALVNVIGQMVQHPSIQQAGYRLNLVPFIRTVTENAFGPRLSPEIFERIADKISIDPEVENEMLTEKFRIPVSPQDDDPKHMQVHMQLMQHPDIMVQQLVREHMGAHRQAMQMKQMQQAMQKIAQVVQRAGKGGQGGGQRPGQRPNPGPRRGAQPALPKPGPQIAGAIPQDQMGRAGSLVPPRRA